jgi:putative endonuclease
MVSKVLSAIEASHAKNQIPVPAKAGTHGDTGTMPAVYLLASKRYGTLYCGSTVDLLRRIWEHKNKVVPGFTATHGVDKLVWYELYDSIAVARQRERQIKEWKRDWKIALIERENPYWIDFYPKLHL